MTERRLVLCLDGTWNSTFAKGERDDGSSIAKPSNVLKLARAVLPVTDSGESQIVYYDAGIGGDADTDGGSAFFADIQKKKQGMWGLGFNANVEQALTFLSNNYQSNGKDTVYVYGFSRGAATARAIVKIIDWIGGLPSKKDVYYLPEILEFYRKHKAKRSYREFQEQRGLCITDRRTKKKYPRFDRIVPIEIEVLGVWDTVYALGSQTTKVKNGAFHRDRSPPKIVRNALHAVALDEQRANFAPALWEDSLPHQNMVQMWFPGVHSNVGGGYPHDGMANVALKWMIACSAENGLEFDYSYLSHYGPYERDRLYNSRSLGYKAFDWVRFKDSGRNILDLPESGNHRFHPCILARVLATKAEILKVAADRKSRDYQVDVYRPEQIKRYIENQADPLEACEAWLTRAWDLGEPEPIPYSPEEMQTMRSRLKRLLPKWLQAN